VVYVIIGITAYYYPNASAASSNNPGPADPSTTNEATVAAIALAKRMIAEGMVF
jgi:hypothetical protein